MGEKPYFPMLIDLSEKQVVVVGAGTIAKRRIRTLVHFTNHLTVVAPEVNPELLQMEEAGLLTIRKKQYEREDLFGADMVIAAATDAKINRDIDAACKCLGVYVDVCADATKGNFRFPGIIKTEDLVVAVSSNGKNPKKSRAVTNAVREILTGDKTDTNGNDSE